MQATLVTIWNRKLSIRRVRTFVRKHNKDVSKIPEYPGTLGSLTIKEWQEVIDQVVANPCQTLHRKAFRSGVFIIEVHEADPAPQIRSSR